MRAFNRTLWFAVAGVGLALIVLYALGDRHPVWQSEPGQKVLQEGLKATAPKPPAGFAVAETGKPIPTVMVRPLTAGEPVDIQSAADGKPMLINFWATWCGPCIREIPELVSFSESDAGKTTRVVGVALDEPDAAKGFVERFKMSYPQFWDEIGPRDASVALGNPAGVLPYSVLIDAQGRMIKQKVGPFSEGEIARWVQTP